LRFFYAYRKASLTAFAVCRFGRRLAVRPEHPGPISITAFRGALLEQNGSVLIEGVAQITPNFSMAGSSIPTNNPTQIRGDDSPDADFKTEALSQEFHWMAVGGEIVDWLAGLFSTSKATTLTNRATATKVIVFRPSLAFKSSEFR